MTLEAYCVAALAVVLTGISKSGFAGGLGILGVPLIALTMPPQSATVLLLPILIGIDLLSVWRYRHAWDGKIIIALIPGALLGIALGTLGFKEMAPAIIQMTVGFMALAFAAKFMVSALKTEAKHKNLGRGAVFLASSLSGFAGFIAHAGGPPIKGVFLKMNLDKSAFVGTNAIFFFLLNVSKAAGYGALGLFSSEVLVSSALLVPFLFIGVWLGFALHKHILQETFTRLAYALLALAGLNLVFLGSVELFKT